jgi:hypothetical protein
MQEKKIIFQWNKILILYQRAVFWCIREQLSDVSESRCLVYQRSAVCCIIEQLSGVKECSCLVYQRAAV